MGYRVFLLALLLMGGLVAPSTGANILLVPFAHGFNSRLMNMQKIADLLQDAGHATSILINSIVEKDVTNKRATWYVYRVPDDVSFQQAGDRAFIDLMMYGPKDQNGLYDMVQAWIDFEMPFCEALLRDGQMLPLLKSKNFDLLLVDVGDDCNRIIADYLNIPTMLYSNYGFSHDTNIFYPQPLSFVCSPELPDVCTSDEMKFEERVANFVAHFLMEFFTSPYLFKQYDDLRQRFNYNSTLKTKHSLDKHVIIANVDFAIDFPRPMMPHIIPISGIFRKDPQPLTAELNEFFARSGKHGVVVLSFGTLISALDDDQAEIFARVFSRLPQKVLWRHSGKRPAALGSNTKLMDWIPQNDILAHPSVVLFITHCGIASTFESAIHGVPVVTVPLFADQRLNSARLVKRAKMGVQVNIHKLNEPDVEFAIRQVINTSMYRENAKATAKLMHDSHTSPKDLFLYWIDFVIRHKGAHHLQSAPARRMHLLQYLGVDVMAAIFIPLFIMATLVFFIILCTVRFLFRTIFSTGVKLKEH